MAGSDRYGRMWGPAAIAVGPLVYLVLRRGKAKTS
jgi:hypothetical protein